MIRAILTDIEGTTSSISFVKDVLFPYARAHLGDFVRSHAGDTDVRSLLNEVSELVGKPLSDEESIGWLNRWIDEDRKFTPLKALQGLVWESGYHQGHFHGHVYADAAGKLREWRSQGMELYVYSSGSVQAQQLLFCFTEFGDLTPLFSGYFDTRVGAKLAADSYRKIAEQIAFPTEDILFLSDVEGELDAARVAGMKTCQLSREGATPAKHHQRAASFDEINLII